MVLWKGFLGAAVAILCFGTYAIPVKMFPTGDGIVFQWIQCCAILIVGYISQAITGFDYPLEPIAMIGGALWCLGNLTVVPIVSTIGLGLGMLIWGLSGMLTGWFCGHFGIIVKKETVGIPWLNYLGVGLAVISFLLYFPIKSEAQQVEDDEHEYKEDIIINGMDEETTESASPFKKLLAILGSILAGLFYGSNMIPVQYLSEKNPGRSVMSFAISHFSGIFLCSTVILIGYIILKRNRPVFYKQSILPAIVAGFLWAIAQNGWFIGDANLSLVVAFPIITTGPAILSSVIGVLIFGEIKGSRNFMFLISAILVTISGILCISFSKPN